MAQTEELLKLIPQFTAAFADPDFPVEPPAFTPSEPDEEGGTGETPQAKQEPISSSFESTIGWCYHCLDSLEHEPELLKIAAEFLTQVADLATRKRHLAMAGDRIETDAECGGVIEFELAKAKPMSEAFVTLELPETFARQSVEGCPSGMCPIDH